MALIRSFEMKTREPSGLHPTRVDCEWSVFERDGQRLLQLDTYGSDERRDKGTVSQTLQLDTAAATELRRILRRAFPDIA
jgi:hypothetical protein